MDPELKSDDFEDGTMALINLAQWKEMGDMVDLSLSKSTRKSIQPQTHERQSESEPRRNNEANGSLFQHGQNAMFDVREDAH